MPLSEDQLAAVNSTSSATLVLGPAGAGKTRVLTHRIAQLIQQEKTAPWKILAVTFSNKAAAEMRDRMHEIAGEAARDVAMGTFHSLCARMLRRDSKSIGINPDWLIADEEMQRQIFSGFLKEDDLPGTGETKPSLVLGAISRAKNDGLTADQMADRAITHHERLVARFARRYAAELKRLDALDFDDLLLEGLRLLQEAPTVADRYRAKWEYLHVDDYQNTTRIQHQWLQQLAVDRNNVFCAGDADAGVFSWRGADIRNILDFKRDWPKAQVVELRRSFRSTQKIVAAAHSVVSNNAGRKDQTFRTELEGGDQITVYGAVDPEDEAAWIARRIEEASAAGAGRQTDAPEPVSLNGIAVLYRTNAQSRAIEEALLRSSIPYQLIGGTRFYQRREVKDALAWLRVLRSDTDRISYERILNVPFRGIGDKTIELLRAAAAPSVSAPDGTPYGHVIAAAGRGEVAGVNTRAQNSLAGVVDVISRLRGQIAAVTLTELLDGVYSDSGLRAHLASEGVEGEERWANLLELREISGRYKELAPPDGFKRFLDDIALTQNEDAFDGDAERVAVMTIHQAIGREWPTVFISGLSEGLFPHSRALMDQEQLEEERRLCYVGITRAKRRLSLSYALRRGWGDGDGAPSRFLAEIPEELLDVANDDDPRADGETRFGRGFRSARAGFAGGESWREGSGTPGAPSGAFRPGRDLEARRRAYGAGARSDSLRVPHDERSDKAPDDEFIGEAPELMQPLGRIPPWASAGRGATSNSTTSGSSLPPPPLRQSLLTSFRVRIPGERYFQDGDRVLHASFGEGIVVTSKLTRHDEEVTIAFAGSGVKTLAASIANLEFVSDQTNKE
jgi:DNA helicase-2/ATP-dependent DNA helicase PcrA